MQYEMDEFNKGLLYAYSAARKDLPGDFPLVGDILQRKDGQRGRVVGTYRDERKVQIAQWSETGEAGSFHLSRNGGMSYSGACGELVDLSLYVRKKGIGEKARCWIWHHGSSGAHRGVNTETFCTVWEEKEPSQIVDKSKPGRYLLPKDLSQYRGSINGATYFTMDGVERVEYCNGQTLEERLAEESGLQVLDWEAVEKVIKDYENSLVTDPHAIQEDDYFRMLEMLPPCRWENYAGWSAFHMAEHLTGNLASWYARKDTKDGPLAVTFVDSVYATREHIARKLAEFQG